MNDDLEEVRELLNAYTESWAQFNKALQEWCNAYNESMKIVHQQIHDMLYKTPSKSNNWNKFHGYPMRRKSHG